MTEILKSLGYQLKQWMLKSGLNETLADIISDYIWLIALFVLGVIIYYITRDIVYKIVRRVAATSRNQFDDFLIERKFFRRLCYLVPAFLIMKLAPVVISDFSGLVEFLDKLLSLYMVFILLISVDAFLNASHDLYLTTPVAKDKPIKGFVQVVKIVVYAIGVIIIIGILFDKKPFALLGGLGALSAVLLLVFKDSLLGFVAGIQLTANNMVKIGDWITLPKHDVDGTVREITLTTVKIENFDKTLSYIPAYLLVSDSVRNWRGMEESGGRRIARAIHIDMNSVKFCTPEMLDEFSRIHYIAEYVTHTESEILKYNQEFGVDNSILVNGRRQTNLGVFRAYLYNYLKSNPRIAQHMTVMVRHLAPTEKGLPIQLYCFAATTAWEEYEKIQADLFDHLLAVIPFFGLKVFQNPTGSDFRTLVGVS